MKAHLRNLASQIERIGGLGLRNKTLSLLGFSTAVSACTRVTGDNEVDDRPMVMPGLPPDYKPPLSIYQPPSEPDPYQFILWKPSVDPYWIKALSSERHDEIKSEYSNQGNRIGYFFPTEMPPYYKGRPDAEGWAPASKQMQIAFHEIVERAEQIFDVKFFEADSEEDTNVIAVSQNAQFDTFGYAYFPNNVSPIAGDILISRNYTQPDFNGATTNFDYELLVHELGHALGLKHPFEADGNQTVRLPIAEDNSAWTVMTYNTTESDFDGFFRPLDMLALADFFGINPTYRASDDIYFFSEASGVQIFDGGGFDTLVVDTNSGSSFVDLRYGSKSYSAIDSSTVTSPFQLTISSGSQIEAAIGSDRADILIGNQLPNLLLGLGGDDEIFGGEGPDTIIGGSGSDFVDLSEHTKTRDEVKLELEIGAQIDVIYGFDIGKEGDALKFFSSSSFLLQDVVDPNYVPKAIMDQCIVRISMGGVETVNFDEKCFYLDGIFGNLSLNDGSSAILLVADSQETGEPQRVYFWSRENDEVNVTPLATLYGGGLDLDNWSPTNFLFFYSQEVI